MLEDVNRRTSDTDINVLNNKELKLRIESLNAQLDKSQSQIERHRTKESSLSQEILELKQELMRKATQIMEL